MCLQPRGTLYATCNNCTARLCVQCRARTLLAIRTTRGVAMAQTARAMLRQVPECGLCSLRLVPRAMDTFLLEALMAECQETRKSLVARLCRCSPGCMALGPRS